VSRRDWPHPALPPHGLEFIKTRLSPDDVDSFMKLLKRPDTSRPLGASSMPAMDHRRHDGTAYISPTHGQLIGKDGRVTRWARGRDLRAAEQELSDFINGGRR